MKVSQVKVGQLEWTVKESPAVIIEGNRNYAGSCSYEKTEITLLETLSEERKEDVFFHELTHAMFHEAGFDDHEEDVVNRLAKIVHQVVKENDFSWLKDKSNAR